MKRIKGKEISLDECKSIQLEILSAVDEFCSINKIKYTIAYGTFLGAVRHKGYIPWDDDIDIFMLRHDYDLFLELFPANYLGKYDLGSIKNIKKWHIPFAKVYDNRTLFYQKKAKTVEIGINIDIFPLDDVHPSLKIEKRQHFALEILKKMEEVKFNKVIRERSILTNVLLIISKITMFFIPRSFLVNKSISIAQIFNNRGFCECRYKGERIDTAFPKYLLDDICDYEFEGSYFKGMNNYDLVLRNQYGDYMKLPPEGERVGKHTIYAYWKK